jgi:glycine oxidase
VASSELDAVDIAQMVPGLRLRPFTRGLWYGGDALVDPRHVMAALRVALGKRGVRIVEGERVARIEANEPTVLAAGAWTSEIGTPGAPIPRAYPIRGHLTAYQLPPGRVGPLVRHHHTYLLQRSNGVFIAGTSEELAGFNRDIDPVVESGIRRRAAEWLPELAGLPSTTWTGFRPAAEGLDPVIGPLNGAPLWLAYGHYRNGILMAPGTAEVVAASIAAHLG